MADKKRVAVLISGGGSNMMTLAQDMLGDPSHPGTPVLVLSNIADADGLAKAQDLGIATQVIDQKSHASREEFDASLNDALRQAAPDVICLAGFMRILSPVFVNAWDGKVLNIHPSLLPKYKGLHTHARAIEAGDPEAGCSVHRVTAGLDEGPVLGQAHVDIEPDDTPETLASRVLVQEHLLYPAVLRRFLGGNEGHLRL
ncbi:phosphoribosylglycinamide formyltransferase [Halocynthiibacter namhaensis]|uniref:phosphoribosylglycinamide formyltransferase n=1 Tax=Halocynthiibacter namhaensis TaxID=1290553 RepID=UPI000579991E|nr:phosphoribosylglycinamide formyltransferase [Halocynthiibacter namhaensis]